MIIESLKSVNERGRNIVVLLETRVTGNNRIQKLQLKKRRVQRRKYTYKKAKAHV
jgi:hypothetical protein